MALNRHSRPAYLALATTVVAGILALSWLADQQRLVRDISFNARHSLGETSLAVLKSLPGPVAITAYATPRDPRIGDLHALIRNVLDPYLRARKDMTLAFIDPAEQPDAARQAEVRLNGELVLAYQNRSEHVTVLNERAITHALERLVRSRERLILFVEGHGERSLAGIANHDLGDFGRRLLEKGLRVSPLNLALAPEVPHNTSLLVLTHPQAPWLPGETAKLEHYLRRGGALLWLMDAEPPRGLQSIAELIGVRPGEGILIDPGAGELLRAPPTLALGQAQGRHPISANFSLVTVFPFARPLHVLERPDWKATPLVEAAAGGWAETDKADRNARFDPKRDQPGPLTVAYALEREVESRSQRIVVTGSGAFLANMYLGNGGNADLGLNMVNWLLDGQEAPGPQPRNTLDSQLAFSRSALAVIGFGFLIVLPLGLLLAGAWVWRRRR
jgi:ABC-type uncharacterized transport system involved in gliding motility auxiliary subunit